eukprot:CAMPEP_0167798052 /NCGR_PEP_ID=MMETSP0111_2-20121227/16055_1 /TAXON_ID=91324 /ORGANISM="Lotharella globosa, Strain CCCM811" /LENGTH=352 /DNA_ID=CAMNT_0007692345 /DNA_START=99 /DNA_END=1157 /DNA_ORIENTATION=+
MAIQREQVLLDPATNALNTLCGVVSRDDPRVVMPDETTLDPLDARIVNKELREALSTSNLEVNIVGDFDVDQLEDYILRYLGSLDELSPSRDVVDPSYSTIDPDLQRMDIEKTIPDTAERAAVVIGQLGPSMYGTTFENRNPWHPITNAWVNGADSEFNSNLKDGMLLWKRSHPLYIPVVLDLLEPILASDMHYRMRDGLGVAYHCNWDFVRNRRHSSGLWSVEINTNVDLIKQAVDAAVEHISEATFGEFELLQAKAFLLEDYHKGKAEGHKWLSRMEGLQQDDSARIDFRHVNDYEKMVRSITITDLYDVWGSFNTDPEQIIRCACKTVPADVDVNDDLLGFKEGDSAEL